MVKKAKAPASAKKSSKKSKKLKKFGVFNIVSDIFQIVLILLLVAVAIVGFGARIPFLADKGLQFFAVTSGSMTPTLPVGSLINVGPYKLEELKAGDIITYQVPADNSDNPAIVTHRIANIDKQEETRLVGEGEDQVEKNVITYSITTKGDANNAPDNYTVKPGNIIGLYQRHVPYLGYVTSFSQTPTGFILLVITPGVILIVWEVISLITHFKEQSLKKSQAEIDQLKQELAKAKQAS